MATPNPIKAELEAARQLDLRRQAQIGNQVKIIDRMMDGADTYDETLEALMDDLLNEQDHVRALKERIAELEGDLAKLERK